MLEAEAELHECHDKSLFVKLVETAPLSIIIGDHSDVHANSKGVSSCGIIVSGSMQRCEKDDPLY